jgi:hypothetical protein
VIALRDLAAFIHLSLLIYLSYPDSEGVFTPSVKAAPADTRTPGQGLGHRLREQETAVTAFNTGHEVIREIGTARRERDGEPAQLTRPNDYPMTAVCLACHSEIRCDGWLLGEWYHTESGGLVP